MYKIIIGTVFGLLMFSNGAMAACASYPYTLTNGTTADASQVMADFSCAALTGAGSFTGTTSFSGPVGIGTGSPAYTLDIQTSSSALIRAKSSGSSAGLFLDRGTNSGFYAAAISFATAGLNDWEFGTSQGQAASDSFGIYDYGAGGNVFTIVKSTGYVGIDSASASYPLYVNGTAYATGAAGALSDARHKKEIVTMGDGALEKVMRLRPVTFLWKEPNDSGMKGKQIGFIAQEVQKVLPSTVLIQDNAEKTLGLKYNEFIPLLTKALQEQQAELNALRAENDDENAEVRLLRSQISTIKCKTSIQTARN